MSVEQRYFRRGFGLKQEVRPLIESEYHSALVEKLRAQGYTAQFGDVTVRLAQEFGFCYGVDRAVDYAYETRRKFHDKSVYLARGDHSQPAREPTHAGDGHSLHPAGRRG